MDYDDRTAFYTQVLILVSINSLCWGHVQQNLSATGASYYYIIDSQPCVQDSNNISQNQTDRKKICNKNIFVKHQIVNIFLVFFS